MPKPNRNHEDESKKSSRRVRSSTSVADYASIDPAILLAAISTVALQGGALRLGYTSDGGAYAIGVYGDGDPYTDYVKPNDDIDRYFRELKNAWE